MQQPLGAVEGLRGAQSTQMLSEHDQFQHQEDIMLDHRQGQPDMDEMMEQILSMASWNESSNSIKVPWDPYSNGGMSNLESMVALLNTSSKSTMLQPSSSSGHQLFNNDESMFMDGSLLLAQLKQQQQNQDLCSNLLDCELDTFRVSKSGITSTTGIENARIIDSWQQQQGYGLANNISNPSLNFSAIQNPKAIDVLTAEAQLLGKRFRNEQQAALLTDNVSGISGHEEIHGGIFSSFASSQVSQLPISSRISSSQVHIAPATQAVRVSDPQTHIAPQGGPGSLRVRVRARRGQATDPHSIAERLRRERIAERMKSLQELVPNSNKTDKASMLDEIIEYVKFLQLQVKVLSMSRLGNAGGGSVSSALADLPDEDPNKLIATALGQSALSHEGISLTERQVAKLMEEDMGSAMQYLQSKGLCLMPIHIAGSMPGKKGKGSTVSSTALPITMNSMSQQQQNASSCASTETIKNVP